VLNGTKYVQVIAADSDDAVLEFSDVLGRSIQQVKVKQHDLIEVPETNQQLLFATLLCNQKRTTIKIY